MSYDYYEYEDQPTDELVYGRCRACYQLEELNEEDLCLICEGQERTNGSRVPAQEFR